MEHRSELKHVVEAIADLSKRMDDGFKGVHAVAEEQGKRLDQVVTHLGTLNSRTAKSENRIHDLESRITAVDIGNARQAGKKEVFTGIGKIAGKLPIGKVVLWVLAGTTTIEKLPPLVKTFLDNI